MKIIHCFFNFLPVFRQVGSTFARCYNFVNEVARPKTCKIKQAQTVPATSRAAWRHRRMRKSERRRDRRFVSAHIRYKSYILLYSISLHIFATTIPCIAPRPISAYLVPFAHHRPLLRIAFLQLQSNATDIWQSFIRLFASIFRIYCIIVFLCKIYAKLQHKPLI